MVMNLSIDTKELDFPAGYQALYSCMLRYLQNTRQEETSFSSSSFKLLLLLLCVWCGPSINRVSG